MAQTIAHGDSDLRAYDRNLDDNKGIHVDCTGEDAEGRHFACVASLDGGTFAKGVVTQLFDYEVVCDEQSCHWNRTNAG